MRQTISVSLLFFMGIFFCAISTAQKRQITSINSQWSFKKQNEAIDISNIDTSDWEKINIPHTWNNQDVLDDGKRGYYRGKGWYFKELYSDFNPKTKNYFLHFEGANQFAEVYINGQKAGEHIGGYSAFTIDITPFLLVDEPNTVLVMVDNSPDPDIPPLSADFTFFGGIYRDVQLIETAKVHFDLSDHGSKGIYVSIPEVTPKRALVTLKGAIHNGFDKTGRYTVSYKIWNKGALVTSGAENVPLKNNDVITPFLVQNITIQDPELWSPDNPSLYQLEIAIQRKNEFVDEEFINFGVRTFHFDADTGFYLNGKQMKLMGVNRHQDYWGKGNALSDDMHRSDLRLAKDMGANFIRLAHYPQDPAILDEADRIGLMVWEETPLVNEVTLSEQHDDNSETMLKEMIRQHYNHPSIILWGYMNEIYWAHRFIEDSLVNPHTEATIKLAKRLENVTRTEDPTRYTAMALHNYPLYEKSGLDTIPQVVGWNLYHGWYYDSYEDFGKFLDEQHQKYPKRIHFISEYGAGSDSRFHSTKPERFDFTIEGQKRMLESYLKQIRERPFIAGATVWNLIDFSSERRIDPNPHINNKGIANADRTPKDVYFLYQASLLKEPFLKIAETGWTERSSVTSENGIKTTLPVQVYANSERVELFQNGKSLGIKTVNDHSAVWEVVFKEGVNSFKAIDPLSKLEDMLLINYKGIPEMLLEENHVDISINAGSNHSFFDVKGKNTWLPDKKYTKGGWGYMDGEPLYVSNKIGTKEDILTITDFIGLYQTMRINTSGYKFDVKDGWYEIELLFVENYPKSRRFVEGIESPITNGGKRIFDVSINEIPLYKELDILKKYGYNYPLRKRVRVKAENGKGVSIKLDPKKGQPMISGIRIRSL